MHRRPRRTFPTILAATLALALTGFGAGALLARAAGDPAPARAKKGPTPIPEPPPGFEKMPVPADNPMTPAKVALGRKLFFDKALSGDGSRSCYSCHVCEKGLTDGLPTAVGAFDKKLTRSSPTLWNIGYHTAFYWDGRAPTLEKQGMAAWAGGNMGADPNVVVKAINENPKYKKRFDRVFAGPATPENVIQAISAFERTIYCGDTRYDKYEQGDKAALSDQEKKGLEIFQGKGDCAS